MGEPEFLGPAPLVVLLRPTTHGQDDNADTHTGTLAAGPDSVPAPARKASPPGVIMHDDANPVVLMHDGANSGHHPWRDRACGATVHDHV